MSKRPTPAPYASPIKGSELRAGMITYIRVMQNGHVAFKRDCTLVRQLQDTGACRNGVHFITDKRKLVCYWRGATVYVKVMEGSDLAKLDELIAGDDLPVTHSLPGEKVPNG